MVAVGPVAMAAADLEMEATAVEAVVAGTVARFQTCTA